ELIAGFLFYELHGAELDVRLTARFVRRHAGAQVLVQLLLDMEANLFVETALETAGSSERSQPPPALYYPSHDRLQLRRSDVEHLVDGAAGTAPLGQLRLKLLVPLARQGVVASAPTVFSNVPLRFDETLPLQPIKRGVEAALTEQED